MGLATLLRVGSGILLLVSAGCQCRPELPSETPPPPAETDEPDPVDTADTDLPTRCAYPETEPDNDILGTADLIPMEKRACGEFDAPLDLDYYTFELTRDSWISVRLDAAELGSDADGAIGILSPIVASREYGDETNDVELTFPAEAGIYEVLLADRNGQGAPDTYFYDFLATRVKEPVSWNRDEVEPNNTNDDAMTVFDGDVVFGFADTLVDRDRYAIAVPVGKHTLTVDVDAFSFGSPMNPVMRLTRADGTPLPEGCDPCEIYTGRFGWENDPYIDYNSSGDEVIFVQISETGGRSGEAWWYTVAFAVEGDP